jgi:hypothetical protein
VTKALAVSLGLVLALAAAVPLLQRLGFLAR